MARPLIVLCVLFLNACVISDFSLPIDPVKFTGETASQSGLNANFRLNTGKVSGYPPAAMIYVEPNFRPVITVQAPDYNQDMVYFGIEDQRVFLESLEAELLARNMIASTGFDAATESIGIVINFIKTEWLNIWDHAYRLDVLLLLKHEQSSDYKLYSILSSDGESIWTKLNTDAREAKILAAEKLLAEIVPDIDEYLFTLSD